MTHLDTSINDGLEREFRKVALEVHGYRRGSLKSALEEAIGLWFKTKGAK